MIASVVNIYVLTHHKLYPGSGYEMEFSCEAILFVIPVDSISIFAILEGRLSEYEAAKNY